MTDHKSKLIILAAGFAAMLQVWFIIGQRTVAVSANQVSVASLVGIETMPLTTGQSESEPLPTFEPKVTLIAVGDIMTSRMVAEKIKENRDYNYPFSKTRDFLRAGDLVFGNLETSITPGRVIKSGEMVFRSDPEISKALANAGFNILSVANNHSPNFGAKGLADTFKYLNESGIFHVGAGMDETEAYAPVFLEKQGLRFGFLAYNDPGVVPASYRATAKRPGTAFMDIAKMIEGVNTARQMADFVIVSMHSGTEYTDKPNQKQKEFARAAIDAGADLVIGHHPHVLQTVEKYQGRYIIYSLGNFIFDQMFSRPTREGAIARIVFTADGVETVEFTPTLIENYGQPRIISEKQSQTFKRLKLPNDE